MPGIHLFLRITFFVLTLSLWVSCKKGRKHDSPNSVRIACAANIRPAIAEINLLFTNQTGLKTELVSGSSGKLAAQIQHGAPYDIFISADLHFPQFLVKEGYAEGPLESYAFGALILWVRGESAQGNLGERLKELQVERIAIANPAIAPYGKAALQAIQAAGVYPFVKDKLVFGESIGQVNQYIQTQSVDAALTSQSFSDQIRTAGSFQLLVDPKLYSPIEQSAVLLTHKEKDNRINARLFLSFLNSKSAKEVLQAYGYQIPK